MKKPLISKQRPTLLNFVYPLKFFKKLSRAKKNSGGFTLIEILVAIGIFSIVVTIAVGGFVRALRAHRLTLAIMAANSNINYVIERMAKEIRTGSDFKYGGTPPCPADVLLCFDNADGEKVEYSLFEGAIARNTPSTNKQKITDANVAVDYLDLYKHDFANYPNRVSINIGIKPKIEGANASTINIQTTVSGRW